jgi:hypothetical protein
MTPKDIRKQVRNVCQELLPELMKSEMIAALKKENAEILAKIEQQNKDLMSFVIRSFSQAPKKQETTK